MYGAIRKTFPAFALTLATPHMGALVFGDGLYDRRRPGLPTMGIVAVGAGSHL